MIHPILLDWKERHLQAVCTPGQHEQQIFRVLLLKTWAWPEAIHGDDMLFRILDLECVLSHFSLRTNIRLAEFLPGLACTHQLIAAPPGPSGAPEHCPTCWYLKPALGEHPQGLLYALNCAKMFLCMSPTSGHAGTWANAKNGTVPKVFSCGPTASLVQCQTYRGDFRLLLPQCCSSLSGICSTANSPNVQPSFLDTANQPYLWSASQLYLACRLQQQNHRVLHLKRGQALTNQSWISKRCRLLSVPFFVYQLARITPKEKGHMSLVAVSVAAVPPPHHRTCLARGISLSMNRVGLSHASGN